MHVYIYSVCIYIICIYIYLHIRDIKGTCLINQLSNMQQNIEASLRQTHVPFCRNACKQQQNNFQNTFKKKCDLLILPGKFAGSAEMIKAINTKGHLFPPTPTRTTGRRDLPSPMSWCRHEPGKGVEVGFGWLFLRLTNMGTWKSPIWKRELIYTNLHCVGEPMLVVFVWKLEVGIGRFVACVLRKYYEFVKDEWRCSISICHIVDSMYVACYFIASHVYFFSKECKPSGRKKLSDVG